MWFGHISRSSWLTKTILQRRVQEKEEKVDREKRWECNINEWTGVDIGKLKTGRLSRRRLTSSVVPQRPNKVMR